MSLSLGGLLTQVVAVVAVVDLDLAGTGHGKSLGRCLVCLNLSHFSFPSFIVVMAAQWGSHGAPVGFPFGALYHVDRIGVTGFMNKIL